MHNRSVLFMDIFECIKGRRSIRSFSNDPISDDDINKILEAGIWAPSAGNMQAWEFVIVRDKKLRQKLAKAAYNQDFIAEAPVCIVVFANMRRSASRYGSRGSDFYCLLDAAAATQNMLLAIHALGYGSVWIGAFNDDAVMRILNAPEYCRPIAILPVGKPLEKPSPPRRLPISKVLHFEQF